MPIAQILQLITTLSPSIINLVMFLKDKETGKLSAFVILDSVDAQVAENQKLIADWLTSHK